jgi:hypothetical protein
MRQHQRARDARAEARGHEQERTPSDEDDDVAPASAERPPDADLAGAQADRSYSFKRTNARFLSYWLATKYSGTWRLRVERFDNGGQQEMWTAADDSVTAD